MLVQIVNVQVKVVNKVNEQISYYFQGVYICQLMLCLVFIQIMRFIFLSENVKIVVIVILSKLYLVVSGKLNINCSISLMRVKKGIR